MTDTGRVETFADGVFAIAITLLVLGIGVPDAKVALWPALVDQWPVFLAYLVSFLTIGIMWVNHHQLFTLIGRSNMTFAFINVVFLMFIAFVPYPTILIAQRIGTGADAVTATVLYGITMLLVAVMFNVIWLYANSRDGHLMKPNLGEEIKRAGARGYQYAPAGYLLITLLAFVNPIWSLALFLLYAVYWVLPVSGPLTAKG